MFWDYYDFPKIPLNRIFCSEHISNPVEALDTFSDCAFTPSPCLRPSCRGPSSPKEFKPQHHTAIVIKTKITICIHLTISSSSSLIQDTQLCSQEKSGNNIDDYSLAEASTAQQLTLATFPHVYLLVSPTDSFFCRWAEAVSGRHGFRHRESLQSKCLKATPHS